MIEYIDWHNCYARGWGNELVPEAFAHPAKVSFALTKRIYDFLFERDLLHAGDAVIDPFAGIGGCAYQALLHGCHFTGVELEEKFARLANANIKMWNERYAGKLPRFGTARVLQGDSRKFAEIVFCESNRAARCAVSSPPYADSLTTEASPLSEMVRLQEKLERGEITGRESLRVAKLGKFNPNTQVNQNRKYSNAPHNLGNLPEGEFSAAVSSPPFVQNGMNDQRKNGGIADATFRKNNQSNLDGTAYGTSDGQLSGLPEGNYAAAISSPPYEEARIGESCGMEHVGRGENYGNGKGQLGNMTGGDYAAAVSSPPYEGTPVSQTHMTSNKRGDPSNPNYRPSWKTKIDEGYDKTVRPYGETDGQLGETQGETFWTASRTIVEQVYAVLAPRGVAVWIVKDFVRKNQRVPFCDQWRELCEHVGFETTHVARAWLVEIHGTQLATDGNHKNLKTERKSFFRRLSEKRGSPRIDFEQVLIMQKTC